MEIFGGPRAASLQGMRVWSYTNIGNEFWMPEGYPKIPKRHPATGEPVVNVDLRFCDNSQLVSWRGPGEPPGKVAIEYDEDGEVVAERTKTDEEHAADVAAWREAVEEYRRTGGQKWIKAGPTTVEVELRTASGDVASLVSQEGRDCWHVVAFSCKDPDERRKGDWILLLKEVVYP